MRRVLVLWWILLKAGGAFKLQRILLLCSQTVLKALFHQKYIFCYLLTPMLSQTFITFFFMCNTKDILKVSGVQITMDIFQGCYNTLIWINDLIKWYIYKIHQRICLVIKRCQIVKLLKISLDKCFFFQQLEYLIVCIS